MKPISEFMITIFEALGLYSSKNGLGEHLRGLDVKCNDYTSQSIYTLVFIYLIAINSIIIVNYYYGIFNRIPFNRWWWWLINSLVSSAVMMVIAFMYTNNDLSAGNYCKDLQMTVSDCWGFGFTTFIYSFIWCCLFSVLIKWKSNVNKKVPF